MARKINYPCKTCSSTTEHSLGEYGDIRCRTCNTRSQTKELRSPLGRAKHAWYGILTRCLNKNHKTYAKYGGAGITVCERWRNSVENFIADMGLPTNNNLEIDRIDNLGNYEPGNCRWATHKENSRNRSNNVHLTFNGKTQTITEWAVEIGVTNDALEQRIRNGWSVERALTTPLRVRKPRK